MKVPCQTSNIAYPVVIRTILCQLEVPKQLRSQQKANLDYVLGLTSYEIMMRYLLGALRGFGLGFLLLNIA